jgi:hypothetical protein
MWFPSCITFQGPVENAKGDSDHSLRISLFVTLAERRAMSFSLAELFGGRYESFINKTALGLVNR